MIPMAGECFGPYEILGTLGRGGVGEVYRAWDRRLEREVAIKLLHDDYPHVGAQERFMIEARAASALSHPNICTIFDIGEKDGAPYLVMELLRGETIKHRIERGGMPAEEIAGFGMEIAEALGAAHAAGIVHRDVKPANIMLVRQSDGRVRVKVLDFGLAKIHGTLPGGVPHEDHLTVPGEAVGTVSYMSPEQARGDELDGRSDLFSLGTVMYEMATRRTPFQGSTTPLLFVQLLNEDPEPIGAWNEEVPRALEKVIFRLLEKEPGRRYQTAADAVAAMASAVGKASGPRWRKMPAAPPPVPLVRVEEPVARAGLPLRPERRSPGMQAGSGAAAREVAPGSGARAAGWAPRARRVDSAAGGDAIRPIRLVDAEATLARAETPSGAEVRARVDGAGTAVSDEAKPLVSGTGEALGQEHEETAPAHGSGFGEQAAAPEEPWPWGRIEPHSGSLSEDASGQDGSGAELDVLPETGAVDETREFDGIGEAHKGAEPSAATAVASAGGVAVATQAVPEVWRADAADETPPEVLRAAVDAIRRGQRQRAMRRTGWWAAAAVGLVVMGGIAGSVWRPAAAVLAPGERVAVAGIENHTGAQMLDGSVAAGLELAMEGSSRVAVVDGGSYAASLRALSPNAQPLDAGIARQAAQATGAGAYLYGDVGPADEGVHGSGAGYRVSVVLRDTAGDRELARAEAKADRIEEIPGAIDRIAEALIGKMGGRQATVGYVPLAREATGSLGALRLYAVGVAAEVGGRDEAALKAYGSAVATDPGFVQALLRISWLAAMENAGKASADAAERADAAAKGRSARTVKLAEAAAEANSRGDLEGAVAGAKALLAVNPQDESAEVVLARAERLQGRFGEAVATAQQGLVASPRNMALYGETELALVGLNRAEDAAALTEKAAKAGLSRPGFHVLTEYLAGGEELVGKTPGKDEAAESGAWTGVTGENEPEALAARGAFLDNTGDLSDGEESWTRAAEIARGQPGLRGEAAALLARAALNRALAGSCADALRLAASAGADQSSNGDIALRVGVAAGLCGDADLAQTAENAISGRTGAASGVAEIRTAVALGRGDAAQAAREARQITGADPMYLGAYLRSLTDVYEQEPEVAIAGLEEILAHRGVVAMAGTNLYPVAELALARAFAGAGDRVNSMEAYGRFLALWDGAGSENVMRAEASEAGRGVLPRQTVLVARAEPVRREPEVTAPTPEVRVVHAAATPVSVRRRGPREPLLTGLPESWFAHPAPGQGSAIPVNGAGADTVRTGQAQENSVE